jgi:hypothetical protein
MAKIYRPLVSENNVEIIVSKSAETINKAVANHWSKGPNAAEIRKRLSIHASTRTGEKSGRYGKTKETNPAFSNGGAPKGTVPHNKGKKWEEYLSPEAIESIIAANTGREPWNKDLHGYLSPETLANMSREGTIHTDEEKERIKKSTIIALSDPEVRKKISDAGIGKAKPEGFGQKVSERVRGSGNPWYIDGRCSGENSEYPLDFDEKLKDLIRDRDERKCKICSVKEEDLKIKLDVHHIDYDKENCDPRNLISLCHSCHMKTNVKRDKWQSFFQGPQRIKEAMRQQASS